MVVTDSILAGAGTGRSGNRLLVGIAGEPKSSQGQALLVLLSNAAPRITDSLSVMLLVTTKHPYHQYPSTI